MSSKRLPLILAWLIVGILAGFLGYESIPDSQPVAHRVDVIVLDRSLEEYAEAWRTEVARRFPDAVVVFAHGTEFPEKLWICKVPNFGSEAITADQLAQYYKDKFPGRTIVLLACNGGHLHLHVHGVWHATDDVWLIPDRAVPEEQVGRSLKDAGAVGSIFEFVED